MTPDRGAAILAQVRRYDEQEWRGVRAGGKRAFILRHGLLARGLPMGALMTFAWVQLQGRPLREATETGTFWAVLIFSVLVFATSGSLAARANWQRHERQFPSA